MDILEKIMEQQRRRYDNKTIWEMDGDETEAKQAEVIIANLVLEKVRLEKLVSWTLESGAKEISLVIRPGKKKQQNVNDIVREFQGNGLDLEYMREMSDKARTFYVRMDFTKVW